MKIALHCIAAFAAMVASGSALAQKSQDRLRVAFLEATQTVAPYLSGGAETQFLSNGIFDNVLSYNEETRRYGPLLAKSFKLIDDRTLEFELRDDVRWHDGQAFDADDVAFTLGWILNPKTKLRRRANWDFIASVEKLGSHKIRITAKTPTPNFLETFAYATPVFPEHIVAPLEDKESFGTKPIGTSMYGVSQMDRNAGAILIKNASYRHGGDVKPASNIGRVEALPVPDKGTQIAHFIRGDLELLRNAQLDQAEDLAKDPKYAMTLTQSLSYIYLMFDAAGRSGLKPVQDTRVRRALMMAVNRDEVYRIRAGHHELPWGTPDALCWDFQDGCVYTHKPPAHDPAAAKKLLVEAGYPDGFDIKITATNTVKDMAEVVVGQLRKIGVRATLDSVSQSSFHAKQTDGVVNALITGWSAGGGPDVARTLNFFFEPGSLDYLRDEKLHALSDVGLTVVDEAKRKAAVREVMDRVTDMAYIMPVAPIPVVFLHSSSVRIAPQKSYDVFGVGLHNLNWK